MTNLTLLRIFLWKFTEIYLPKFKKAPEEKIPPKCLWIIVLDSVLYAYKKYHPKIFLIKAKKYIDKEFKSDSDSNDSDSDSDTTTTNNNKEFR